MFRSCHWCHRVLRKVEEPRCRTTTAHHWDDLCTATESLLHLELQGIDWQPMWAKRGKSLKSTYVVFTGRIMKLMEDYSASQVGVTEDNYQKWWFKHQQLSFSYVSANHETWWYHGIFTNIMLLSMFVGLHSPSTSYSPVWDMTLWGLSNQSVRIQPYFQWSILKTASKNPQLVWSTCNIHSIF